MFINLMDSKQFLVNNSLENLRIQIARVILIQHKVLYIYSKELENVKEFFNLAGEKGKTVINTLGGVSQGFVL